MSALTFQAAAGSWMLKSMKKKLEADSAGSSLNAANETVEAWTDN